MSYDSRSRDRYRLAVRAATATVAAAAITGTGWVAGAVAHEQTRADAQQQAKTDALARANYDAWVASYGNPADYYKSRTVLRERPAKTRVSTRYVTGVAPSSPGQGGTVSSTPSQPTGAGNPVPQPPPPPPPPPPAPSNGS